MSKNLLKTAMIVSLLTVVAPGARAQLFGMEVPDVRRDGGPKSQIPTVQPVAATEGESVDVEREALRWCRTYIREAFLEHQTSVNTAAGVGPAARDMYAAIRQGREEDQRGYSLLYVTLLRRQRQHALDGFMNSMVNAGDLRIQSGRYLGPTPPSAAQVQGAAVSSTRFLYRTLREWLVEVRGRRMLQGYEAARARHNS